MDILVPYDYWTIMANSPAIRALVPEIMRQQYLLVALNSMKQYENGLLLNGQAGKITRMEKAFQISANQVLKKSH